MSKIFTVLLIFSSLMLFAPSIGVAEKIGSGPYDDNCVLYLRKVKGVRMPSDLTYWKSKLAIINKDKPKKGYVAIIEVGGAYREYGHVALVTKVDDDGKKQSITIEEANYPSRGYWKRKYEAKGMNKVEKMLGIKGYYKP